MRESTTDFKPDSRPEPTPKPTQKPTPKPVPNLRPASARGGARIVGLAAGVAAAPAAMAVLMVASGCQPRILAPTTADGLRAQLAERTRERDAAQARVAELETELARAATAPAVDVGPDGPFTREHLEELPGATPALASVAISSLSSVKVTGPGAGQLALVIAPSDGVGRFVQIAGVLRASAAAIVPGREPMPAAAATIGPKALRAAYRSGFLGTHYTIEIPLRWSGEVPPRAVSVAVDFTDGPSRRTFSAAGTIDVLPERAPVAR